MLPDAATTAYDDCHPLACLPCGAGANPRLDDNLGRSALLEACYHGHDHIIDTLKAAGASLGLHLSSSSSSGRLSTSGSSSSNISGVRSSGSGSSRGPAGDLAAAGSFGSLSLSPGPGGDDVGVSGSLVGKDGVEGSHIGASWVLQLASLLCNCVYECNLPVRGALASTGQPVSPPAWFGTE